jgi:hypothetical protein
MSRILSRAASPRAVTIEHYDRRSADLIVDQPAGCDA